MKFKKPLKTNDDGVSPGCTRLLRKNTYTHTLSIDESDAETLLIKHHPVVRVCDCVRDCVRDCVTCLPVKR